MSQVFEDVFPNSDLHHTILMPDVKYNDMLLLVRFIYGGEVTVPLKQLGTLQELIQVLQLDPGHASGKFVFENIDKSGIVFGGSPSTSTTATVVSSPTAQSVNVTVPHPNVPSLGSPGGSGGMVIDTEMGQMPHVSLLL